MTITKKIFLSSFIIFNFLALVRTYLPTSQFLSVINPYLDSYLSFINISSDRRMYISQEPSQVKLLAEVKFEDGSSSNYEFPVSNEQFRRFSSVSATKESNSFLWRDTSRFALRKIKDENFDKFPVKVQLTKLVNKIPEVDDEFRSHSQQSENFKRIPFYTYEVL